MESQRGIEDAITYQVYYPDQSTEHQMRSWRDVCITLVTRDLDAFIWQKDSFQLFVRPVSSENSDVFCLEGTCAFGDNIEDEWLIVGMLFKISEQFPKCVVRVFDNDGEFLLIEAAEQLPRWVSDADKSENRVFVHQGQVHLIPFPSTPAEITIYPAGTPTIEEALRVILSTSNTKADEGVQAAIQARIALYPQKALKTMHRSRAFLPQRVALLLSLHPQLISSAVTAFYERDALDMKTCSKMLTFPPQTRLMSPLTISRCLYAQLMQQKFHGGAVFGRMPLPSSPDYKPYELGLKIACGFEILANRSSRDEFAQNEPWKEYIAKLEKFGYFKENIAGSAEYRRLLDQAKVFFLSSVSQEGLSALTRQHIAATLIRDTLNSTSFKELDQQPPAWKDIQEDDDSWMTMTVEDFDASMRARQVPLDDVALGGSDDETDDSESGEEEDEQAKAAGKTALHTARKELDQMVESFSSFLGKTSSFKGAEFDTDDDNDDDDDDAEIDFDVNTFLDILQNRPQASASQPAAPNAGDAEEEEQDIHDEYDQHLQAELRESTVLEGYSRNTNDGDDDDIDIDLNLVSNFLESFSAQEGLAGPVSNLMGSLGVRLPDAKPKRK